MKLKKIVSLALAGVLAVSMLAGCATTKPETKPEDPTETSSISKEVGALIKDVPSYVTFEDSTSLDAALKKAVQYAGVMNVMPNYVWNDTLTNVDTDIYDVLADGVKTTGVWYTDIGDQATLLAAEKDSGNKTTLPNAVAADMTVISTAIGEDAVKEQIADHIEKAVKGYQYALDNNSTNTQNSAFKYNYVVSISTCTKTVNSSVQGNNGNIQGAADPSVTFVAVQVVRTATHY